MPAKKKEAKKAPKKAVKKAAKKPVKKPAKKPAKKPGKQVGKKKVSFKKEMTARLEEERGKILNDVARKISGERSLLKHEIGDIYDIASKERERELTLMLGDRERQKLSEIEEALERIKISTYGACEECGEPIAENRLRILPFTRVCVECQSKTEKELKIRGRVVEEEVGLGVEKPEVEEEEF